MTGNGRQQAFTITSRGLVIAKCGYNGWCHTLWTVHLTDRFTQDRWNMRSAKTLCGRTVYTDSVWIPLSKAATVANEHGATSWCRHCQKKLRAYTAQLQQETSHEA